VSQFQVVLSSTLRRCLSFKTPVWCSMQRWHCVGARKALARIDRQPWASPSVIARLQLSLPPPSGRTMPVARFYSAVVDCFRPECHLGISRWKMYTRRKSKTPDGRVTISPPEKLIFWARPFFSSGCRSGHHTWEILPVTIFCTDCTSPQTLPSLKSFKFSVAYSALDRASDFLLPYSRPSCPFTGMPESDSG
jgi:hypothetical protein